MSGYMKLLETHRLQKKIKNLEAEIEENCIRDNDPLVLNRRMRNYLRLPVGFNKDITSMVSLADYFKTTEDVVLFYSLPEDKKIEFTAYFLENDRSFNGFGILYGPSFTKEESINEVRNQTEIGIDLVETQSSIIESMIEMFADEFKTIEDLYKKFPEFKDTKIMY